MDTAYVRSLYDYNYWARDRVISAANGLSQNEYVRPNGFTYGSLRGILLHAMWAEAVWLARWSGEPRVESFSEQQYATFASLVERWQQEEAKMRSFLAVLTDERLGSEVTYRSTRSGQWHTDPLWQLMVHVVNHATQHRAEAAEALTMAGRSPGDLDLLDFFREGRPA
jgi:uncharacterized damage-inducible protein DinB